jgi:hypothetical protein
MRAKKQVEPVLKLSGKMRVIEFAKKFEVVLINAKNVNEVVVGEFPTAEQAYREQAMHERYLTAWKRTDTKAIVREAR